MLVRLKVATVKRHVVLYVYAIALFALLDRFNIIAYLALEADVRHEAIARLRIYARHIARVRVPVGISVFNIKKNYEFIAVPDGFHFYLSSFFV